MRDLFPHRLLSQNLFCRRCGKVRLHGLFAREPYSTYGGMESHIPLLCICEKCETAFVAFSHEFRFCRREEMGDYAKVYGRNRIAPGNWVYFRGTQKPGKVKSYFQTNDKEVIVVSYDNGVEKKFENEKVVVEQEIAPEGYRLLPAQSALTFIGDNIYHAIRDQFGVVVGNVNDGEKDKLAVQLDDSSLLFITLPPTQQNIPNAKLSELAKNKISQLFPEDARHISLTVGQGIVYLDGVVRNLSAKRALCACVNGMPRVRGCVDFMRIRTETYLTDNQIRESILRLLETPGLRVYNYSVDVKKGKVDVHLSCYDESFPRDLENKISEFPGVQDLNLSISSMPADTAEKKEDCREMEFELSTHPRLAGSVIKISFVNNKFLMEGRVGSIIQKQFAALYVAKQAFTTSIDNRLRVV